MRTRQSVAHGPTLLSFLIMRLIRHALEHSNPKLPTVAVCVFRQTLAKRRWRARAEDGVDFGFELATPLKHGARIFQTDSTSYVIEQKPEPLLLIRFGACKESAAIAWQIGNLHFPIAVEEGGLLVEDDLAVRQMLERERISFTAVEGVFQPLCAAGAHHHHHEHAHSDSESAHHAHAH
jgi:urease accessory protein